MSALGRATMPAVVRLPGLRRERLLAGLTQDDLATKTGMGRPNISRLERGGEATVTTARKLAEALGCRPRDLIEPESPPH